MLDTANSDPKPDNGTLSSIGTTQISAVPSYTKPTAIGTENECLSSSPPSPHHSSSTSAQNTTHDELERASSASSSSSTSMRSNPGAKPTISTHNTNHVDFIDSGACLGGIASLATVGLFKRTSRTKLHKISSAFNPIETHRATASSITQMVTILSFARDKNIRFVD